MNHNCLSLFPKPAFVVNLLYLICTLSSNKVLRSGYTGVTSYEQKRFLLLGLNLDIVFMCFELDSLVNMEFEIFFFNCKILWLHLS